MDTICVI